MQFSPQGDRIVTGGYDETVRLWDLQGQELTKFEGHQGIVGSVQFSPQGDRIVTSGDDGTARLWDLQGQELTKFEGHQGYVLSVQFSPQGDRIVTIGFDNTTRLWDLQGNQIAQYEGLGTLNDHWTQMALIQDPNPLLSPQSPGQIVTLWPVDDLDSLLSRACTKLHGFLLQSSLASDDDRALCGLPPRP